MMWMQLRLIPVLFSVLCFLREVYCSQRCLDWVCRREGYASGVWVVDDMVMMLKLLWCAREWMLSVYGVGIIW